jgi:hypothetical protein
LSLEQAPISIERGIGHVSNQIEGTTMSEQQVEASPFIDQRTAQDQLNRVLMAAFCRTLNNTRLSPIVVMRMIAEAVGKTYADVATTHQTEQCPCGWQPSVAMDIQTMRAALAFGGASDDELLFMTTVGRA